MNLLGRFIYILFGMFICAGLLIASDRLESSKLIIPEEYNLKNSEVICPSCPEQKSVKCDLSDGKITCEFDVSVNNYWQNVFPSEQCAGINYKQMDLFRMPHKTGSMRPTIYSNDLLLTVEYNSSKSLVLGDIVGNGKILHRIVRLSDVKEEYITKGDNNKDEDSAWISWNETKYIVCGVLRGTK